MKPNAHQFPTLASQGESMKEIMEFVAVVPDWSRPVVESG